MGEHKLTVESCDNREKDMRNFLQARIDTDSKKIAGLRDRIINAMSDYVTAWPLDTREDDREHEHYTDAGGQPGVSIWLGVGCGALAFLPFCRDR